MYTTPATSKNPPPDNPEHCDVVQTSESTSNRPSFSSAQQHTRRLGRVKDLGVPQRLGFSDKKVVLSSFKPSSLENFKSRRRLEPIEPFEEDETSDIKPIDPQCCDSLSRSSTSIKHSDSNLRERHSSSNNTSSSRTPHCDGKQSFSSSTKGSTFTDRFFARTGSSGVSTKTFLPFDEKDEEAESPVPKLPILKSKWLQTTEEIKKTKSSSSSSLSLILNKKENEPPPLPPVKETNPPLDGDDGKHVIRVNGESYVWLKIIGKGGSSKVYEVIDRQRRLRAIKIVDLSDESMAAGYLNEINMLKRLQSSNRIVKMFDYEYRKDEDLLLVVMERGDTDFSSVLNSTNLTPSKIKFYWEEILKVTDVIHKAGIIHSDLKPANFLLVAGTWKLIDFGIASAVQSDNTSVIKNSQAGTFNFMSPEAIQDCGSAADSKPQIKIGYKSDVWSLGCILYSMAYGKTPFSDIKNPWTKCQAIIDPRHVIPFPSDESKDPLLIDTIKRCLVRDPAERASIRELLQHPYLTEPRKDVDHVLSLIESACTPKTREGLLRAKNKLSATNLKFQE